MSRSAVSERQQRAARLVRDEMRALSALKQLASLRASSPPPLKSLQAPEPAAAAAAAPAPEPMRPPGTNDAPQQSASPTPTLRATAKRSGPSPKLSLHSPPRTSLAHAIFNETHGLSPPHMFRTNASSGATARAAAAAAVRLQKPKRNAAASEGARRRKQPRDFVVPALAAGGGARATVAAAGTAHSKAVEAARAEMQLREADARLRRAVLRMEAQKAADEEEAKLRNPSRRRQQQQQQVQRAAATTTTTASASAVRSEAPPDDAYCGVNDESISLECNLDAVLLPAITFSRNPSPLKRTAAAEDAVSRGPADVSADDGEEYGILKLYGGAASLGCDPQPPLAATRETQDNRPMPTMSTGDFVLMFDIPPDPERARTRRVLTDSTTTTTAVREPVDEGGIEASVSKSDDSIDPATIVIRNDLAALEREIKPTSTTVEIEVQTTVTRMTGISLPQHVVNARRSATARFTRLNTRGAADEPVDAMERIADEIMDDLLVAVTKEVEAVGEDFVRDLISAEFLDDSPLNIAPPDK
ncbi:hypothetical protein HDU82_002167 [Entophlyctis luteolus]|nr:hypothetical protein HDU82_002167 [Entophlyctis luteolus]